MTDSDNDGYNQFRFDPKNIAVALLIIIMLIMGFVLAKNTFFRTAPELAHYDTKGEKVSVFEVQFDRDNFRFVDIVFDEPIGKDEKGEVLGRDPATISPVLNGSWSWISSSVLRFQASDRFGIATDYTISLIPGRLLKKGQVLKGKSEFEVRTGKFKVEQSTVDEEPVINKKNTVTLQGTLRFNYSVDPKVLARKISLSELSESKDSEGQSIPIKLKTGYWNTSIKWVSGPIEKKKEEREVELKILGDLTPAAGNVALGDQDYSQIIPIGSKDNLSVRDVVSKARFPKSNIKIKFSSAISPEIAADYISIKPPAKYSIQRIQNALVLKGNFKPGSSYEVTIQKGLPAVDDAVLQEQFTKKLRFSNLEPSIEFESPGMFLDSKGTQAVKIKSINVKEVDLTVDRVYLNNLFFLFQSYGYSVWRDEYYQGTIGDYFGNRITKEKLNIDSKLNQQLDTVLDLKKYIPSNETGLYQVGIVPKGAYQGVQKWVLITDIGIVVKNGEDELLVWTSSFSNLEPISGAEVHLISKQNQVVAKGVTDSEGMLRIKGLKQKLSEIKPYMVTVKKGSDYSFLILDTMEIDTSGLDVGGAVASAKGYTAYAYGERNIYRPGETVEGVSIIRDSSLITPAPMPIILKHIDPKGRVVKTIKENMSDKGLVPFEFALADYSPTGNHTIEILVGKSTIGRYKFQVEEFVPDRIKVKVYPEKDNISVGEKLSYEVRSSYLFGPPSSELPVETRVDLVERPFLPDGYKGFVFTNQDRKFKSREIFVKKTTLNKEGLATFSVELPEGLTPPSSLQAQIRARVQETGGRGVTSNRKINVDPYPYYLGLKRKNADHYAEPGQDVEFGYVALAQKGDDTLLADTGALKAELYKDSWNTVLRKTPSGNYKYESVRDSTLIDSILIDSGGAKGTFTFNPPEFGSYRVVLSDPKGGSSTQTQFYASGWGFSPWALENPARIELDLEKTEYMPTEVANVQIRAPFGGKLLLTVERGDVYYTKILNMDGNTATVPVPVSDKYRPNAYITATIIRSVKDLEPGSAGRAFGAIPINVDKTENEMNVDIEAPEEIRPNSELEVTVKTVPNSSVTVAAVDEGILQLIAQKRADPFDFFYRKLALAVNSYDTFSLLLPDVALGASPAGGGYAAKRELQFLSTQGIRRVKPVAFWSGIIEADESGMARVRFDVPRFQGALRVMAVSIDGKQFGSSEAFVKVKSPVVILPTVPRFFSLHEKVIIPVSVRNDTGQDGLAQVRLTADGPVNVTVPGNGSEDSGDTLITVDIPNNSEKTVYFNINTFDDTGATKITIEASVNKESSGTVIDVPILPDLPRSTQENVGRITSNDGNLAIENVNYFRSGTLEREVHISKLPLIQFSGKLEYLVQYPYGCLEQVTSKVFPLIYLSDIAKELDPKLFNDSDPEAMVQEGIRRISSMQMSGGGFSLWPGGGPVQPWASIYTSHFLVEAKRAGFFIEESVYSSAMSFLNSEAKAKPSYSTGELERAVYALYVLSRDGQADLSTMDFIRERHLNELTVESKAFLSGAYAAQGDSSALEEILKGIDDVEQVERQTGDNFNSTIRNRAILLLAILDINPDDPRIPTLVDRLSRDAKVNQWWTTQESSFALLALGQFIKKQTASEPFSGTAYLGDKKLGVFTSDATFSVTGLSGTDPIRIDMDEGYEAGSAFYSVITRGYPTPGGFKPVQSGLNVERAFLTRSGAPVDFKNLEQGDLIVVRTKIQSESGRVDNVVIENLLPSGFEVENPRLKTTETLKWATGNKVKPGYLDIRDDRILIFTDLPANKWYNYYALLRVVNPGTFTLPPIQAEAMYSPNIRYTGKLEDPINVNIRK